MLKLVSVAEAARAPKAASNGSQSLSETRIIDSQNLSKKEKNELTKKFECLSSESFEYELQLLLESISSMNEGLTPDLRGTHIHAIGGIDALLSTLQNLKPSLLSEPEIESWKQELSETRSVALTVAAAHKEEEDSLRETTQRHQLQISVLDERSATSGSAAAAFEPENAQKQTQVSKNKELLEIMEAGVC